MGDVVDRAASSRRARFVTLEGVDGAGKSTHIPWFADRLRARTGDEVVLTREPGGTSLGEALRALLLTVPMDLDTETLLMFAARRQHVVELIEPALARGAWVVCDRFTDATFAYQGAGRRVPRSRIEVLRTMVHPDLEPGATLIFDLDSKTARDRMDATRDKDRFEQESLEFFDRVRGEYLRLAGTDARRYRLIDSAKSIAEIQVELEDIITTLCYEARS